MAKQTIPINLVLSQINQAPGEDGPQEFSLGFIRKTKNAKRGTFKEVNRCIKKGFSHPEKGGGDSKGGRKSPNLKANKTLLLFDREIGRDFYVGIETIIQYNGQRVTH